MALVDPQPAELPPVDVSPEPDTQEPVAEKPLAQSLNAPIEAHSADGVVHRFPADTPPEAVDAAMEEYAKEHANKTTTGQQMVRGFMDPVEGGGQLISELLPESVRSTMDQFNNWLAKYSGGLIRELPPGGKSQQMRAREAQITQERGVDKDKLDWPRMAGDVLNPVNWMGGLGGAGKVANIGRALAGGVTAGAISPVADPNYWREKGKQTLLGGAFGLTLGAAGAAVSKGLDAAGRYLIKSHPEFLENEAVRKIIRRMASDTKAGGPDATEMIELVNASNKPLALVDVGGRNVKGLAGNVARQPGASSEIASGTIGARDSEAAQRLSADIAKYVHGGPTAFQSTEALLAARSAASKPAYDAVHDLQGVWSPRLQQFLDDPAIKSGLARGYELERLTSVAEGRPISTTQLGVDLDIEGNIKMLGTPNMRLLDMGKRGLDAMIADERNEITGRLTAKGVALDQVRRAYVRELDALDTKGIYKKARDAWAGHSASMDAIRLGRSVFSSMSPEEIAAEVGKLSEANKAFYRIGVADRLKEQLAKTGLHGDEAKALIKNPWMRDKLRPAFRTSEDFERFVNAVTEETQMFETGRKILGGSQTGERIAEDVAGQGVERALEGGRVVSELATGHPVRAAINAWRLYRDLGLKPNPELNEKIAQILFTADLDPRVAGKLTSQISSEIANPAAGSARRMSKTGVIAGTAGGVQQTKSRQPPKADDQ